MGWRERDWARLNYDERRHLFGGGGRRLPPSAEGVAHGLVSHGALEPSSRQSSRQRSRRTGVSRRRQRIGEWILACLLALGLTAYALDRLDPPRNGRIEVRPVLPIVQDAAPTAPVAPEPPSDVVVVRWRGTDLSPAATAGRVCVSDPRHGRVCASYVTGERPADSLTRELERRGLHVQSSG